MTSYVNAVPVTGLCQGQLQISSRKGPACDVYLWCFLCCQPDRLLNKHSSCDAMKPVWRRFDGLSTWWPVQPMTWKQNSHLFVSVYIKCKNDVVHSLHFNMLYCVRFWSILHIFLLRNCFLTNIITKEVLWVPKVWRRLEKEIEEWSFRDYNGGDEVRWSTWISAISTLTFGFQRDLNDILFK